MSFYSNWKSEFNGKFGTMMILWNINALHSAKTCNVMQKIIYFILHPLSDKLQHCGCNVNFQNFTSS
jgi:hypothetical protein